MSTNEWTLDVSNYDNLWKDKGSWVRVRILERSMLHPFYDENPIEKVWMYKNSSGVWEEVTGELDKEKMDCILKNFQCYLRQMFDEPTLTLPDMNMQNVEEEPTV